MSATYDLDAHIDPDRHADACAADLVAAGRGAGSLAAVGWQGAGTLPAYGKRLIDCQVWSLWWD